MRPFRRFLFIVSLTALGLGISGVWRALRHGNPKPIVLTADATQEIPDHVVLQNIHLSVTESVMIKQYWAYSLYVPVRPKGASKDSPVHVLLKNNNPQLLEVLTKEAAKDGISQPSATTPLLRKLGQQSEATGMVAGPFDWEYGGSKVEARLHEAIPALDRDFTIVVEGEKPSWLRGLGWLAASFLCLVLLGRLTLAEPKPSTAAAAPPPH